MRAALTAVATACALAAAGCGGARQTTKTAPVQTASVATIPSAGLRVGVVGPLQLSVPGAVAEHGSLDEVAGDALVLVSAHVADAAAVAAVADAHPTSHFALVGGSSKGFHRRNLVGLVLDDEQAAELAGVVAGLVAAEQGGLDVRVAWVGPEENALATAFAHGAQRARPGTVVLRAWSSDLPAPCKEAALGAIDRGAVAVMAHGGACGEAAVAGAHQQNRVGLELSDFELPDVPAGVLVRDAVNGVYRGGEDIVFGAASGAVGVVRLDQRISPDVGIRARAAAQELASGLRATG